MAREGRPVWRERLAVPFLLLILPFLFFWPETLGWRGLGDQDALFWFFPAYQFVVTQIKSGGWPLWNPDLYSGIPLFALWQAGMLDPLNWLHLLVKGGPTTRTLTVSLQLTFSLALLTAYGYGRAIGLSRRAAFLSSIIYTLSGFAVARVLYPGFLHAVALMPWILLVVERLSQKGRWRDVVFGALLVTWQVFAAHPQPLLYGAGLIGAYALFRGPLTRKFLWQVTALYALGALGAAIQLLPAAEHAQRSVREGWGYELFTLHSIHPASLLTVLIPFFHGQGAKSAVPLGLADGLYPLPYWGISWHHNETQIYLGVLALALALGGAWQAVRSRDRVGLFWVGAALAGLLLAMGKYLAPLAKVLYHVPVLSNFRSPNRYWMIVALAVAVLAGRAFDRFWQERERGLRAVVRGAALLLTLLVGTVGTTIFFDSRRVERFFRSMTDWQSLPEGFLDLAQGEFLVPIGVAMLGCLLLWIGTDGRPVERWSHRWSWLLLAGLLAEYHLYALLAPIHHAPGIERAVGRAVPPTLRALSGEDPATLDRAHVLLAPKQGEFSPLLFAGKRMATGYDPLLDQRYKTWTGIDEGGRSYLGSILMPRDRTLDLLNVRHVLVPPDWEPMPLSPLLPVEIPSSTRLRGEIVPPPSIDAETLHLEAELPTQAPWEVTVACGTDPSWSVPLDSLGGRIATRVLLPPALRLCSSPLRVEIAHGRRPLGRRPEGTGTGEDRLRIHGLGIENAKTGERRDMTGRHETATSSRWRETTARSGDPGYADYRVLENQQHQPRCWLVAEALPAYDGDQLKWIRGDFVDADGRPFDPRRTALVEMAPTGTRSWYDPFLTSSDGSEEQKGVDGEARLLSQEADRLRIETHASRTALLLVSEPADPGWKVTVDGQEQTWHRVDYHLRAVTVPAGRHLVEYRYRPTSLGIGAGISLATGLLLTGILWRTRLKAAAA